MPGMAPSEKEVIIKMAREDVSYWEWAYWSRMAAKEGRCSMGLVHVLLPYRDEPAMPFLRRELNEIYLNALKERAADFGMEVAFGDGDNRIYLVARTEGSNNRRKGE